MLSLGVEVVVFAPCLTRDPHMFLVAQESWETRREQDDLWNSLQGVSWSAICKTGIILPAS